MPIKLIEEGDGKTLVVQVSEKIVKEDYAVFVSSFERLVQRHGKLRLLLEMSGFHGWTAGAAWEDINFGLKHFSDIDRIAMVGETKWQKGMATFCKPFTRATVRYFDHSKADEARVWLGEGQLHMPPSA